MSRRNHIDSANEALIDRIVFDRLPSDVNVLMDIINGVNDSTTIKNTKKISKIGKAAVSIASTLAECVEDNSDCYVITWDWLKYYYDEVFDTLVVHVGGLSASYIKQLKVSEELKNIVKGFGDVTQVVTFLEGLASSILLYDYKLQVVNEILETVPSDTSLYKGMLRLKNRLERGFIACYINDEIVDEIFSKVSHTLIKFVSNCIKEIKASGKIVTERAALTQAILNGCLSLTQVIMKNVFKIATPDEYFEFELIEYYRNDMYSCLKNVGTKYCDNLTFLSDDIGEYEKVFEWYIITSSLTIDKLKGLCNHNVNYGPTDITADYYELSYDKFIEGTKSFLYHFKANGADSTFQNESNVEQEILIVDKNIEILNPCSDIRNDKIYLADNKIRSSIKLDKSTITVPNDVTVYVEGNVNIENGSVLKIDGNLVISGNLNARYSDIEIGENGSLSVMEDVEFYATNIIADSDFNVDGGLRYTRKTWDMGSSDVETTFVISKKMIIGGDLYSEDIITINKNAILDVNGDIATKPVGASVFGVYNCGFEMKSNSELRCNNLDLRQLHGLTNTANSYIKADEGTKIYVEGDVFLGQSDYLNKNNATIFLCGKNGIQTINGMDVYDVVVTNKDGLKMESDIKVYGKLNMNGNPIEMGEKSITVYSNGSLSEGTFYKNVVFESVSSIDYSLKCGNLKIVVCDALSTIIEQNVNIVSNSDVVVEGNRGTLINNGLLNTNGELKQGYGTTILNNSIINVTGSLDINYQDSKAYIFSYTSYTRYNDYGKTTIGGNITTYTRGIYEACLQTTELHLCGDAAGDIKVSKGLLFFEGHEKQNVKGVKSLYIVEIKNSAGVVFNDDISVTKLFNHNQNLFVLKDDGKNSIFADYDGDGYVDSVDFYPLDSLYHNECRGNHIQGDIAHENIVEATCTEDGTYDEVVYCTKCGEELSRKERIISCKGHFESVAIQENHYVKDLVEYYDEVIYCISCNKELSREKRERTLLQEDKVEFTTKLEITTEMKEAGIDSLGKIEEELYRKLSAQGTFDENNVIVYDAKMYFSQDNGITWTEATADSFPSEGIQMKIPYPEGTNMFDYDFVVVHMFAHTMNGFKAGEIETPQVTKTNDGIEFTVYGLSPIAISWFQIDNEPIKNDISPVEMGDDAHNILWLLASFTVMISLIMYLKKRNRTT